LICDGRAREGGRERGEERGEGRKRGGEEGEKGEGRVRWGRYNKAIRLRRRDLQRTRIRKYKG
jgi:hypothetical protein